MKLEGVEVEGMEGVKVHGGSAGGGSGGSEGGVEDMAQCGVHRLMTFYDQNNLSTTL